MVTMFRANKREIPGGMPAALWRDKVLEYVERDDLGELPWYHSVFEYLSPEELARLRAKALIWREVENQWPEDISYWMELRRVRKRGELPHTPVYTMGRFDEDGTLHCGHCAARWTRNHDGRPQSMRCGLCDYNMVIMDDRRL